MRFTSAGVTAIVAPTRAEYSIDGPYQPEGRVPSTDDGFSVTETAGAADARVYKEVRAGTPASVTKSSETPIVARLTQGTGHVTTPQRAAPRTSAGEPRPDFDRSQPHRHPLKAIWAASVRDESRG